MFSSIRKILSVRQRLVLAVAAIIGPFWIINYEEWLKTRKLDRVLIETDKAMSEPNFWGSVVAIWDSVLGVILEIANSEYVIGGLVAVLVYAFAPLPIRLWRHFFATSNSDKETAPIVARKYVSPFEGKVVAPPEPTPQRLINVIDSQDEHLSNFIYRVRIWVRKHFEAANPYIDIHIELGNSSVFELTYEGFQGRFFYRDDPLKDRPEIISHDEKIGPNSYSSYTIRQFINSDFCDVLANHRHQRQELSLSENFCIKFSYLNRGDQKKEAYWPLMREPFDISEQAD